MPSDLAAESARRIAARRGFGEQAPAPESDALGLSLLEGLGTSEEALGQIERINPARQVAEQPVTAETYQLSGVPQQAVDDAENLNFIERFAGDLSQSFRTGLATRELGRLGFEAMLASGLDDAREFEIRKLQEESAQQRDFGLPDGGVTGFLVGAPGAAAETLPQMAESVVSSLEGGAVGFLGGAAFGQPAAGAGIGARAGLIMSTARAEGGSAFLEFRDIEGPDGEKIPRDEARAMALGVGAFNGVVEAFGLKLLPGVGRVVNAFSRKGAREVLEKPILRHLLTQVVKSGIKGIATEGGTEAVQEVASALGAVALHLRQGNPISEFKHSAVDPETGNPVDLSGTEAIWARVLEAMKAGGQAGLVFGAGGRTAEIAFDSDAAQRAKLTAKRLVGLEKAAKQSALRESNPEVFKDHIRRSVKAEGAADSVFMSPTEVQEFFATADADTTRALFAAMPELPGKLAELEATGADLVVSMEDYLTHIAPSPMGSALERDTRLDPGEMTLRQAEEFEANLEQELQAAIEQDAQRDETTPTEPTQTADQAFDDDTVVEQVREELQAGTTQAVPTAVQARRAAQRMILETKIRDVQPGRYRAAAAREADLALEAANQGRPNTAQAHKQKQLLNAALEAAARRTRKAAESSARYFNRVQTRRRLEVIGRAGHTYGDQIVGLLERFDLRLSTTLRDMDLRKDLAAFIQEQEDFGEEVIIPEKFRQEIFRQPWKELTSQELFDLEKSIKNIEHLARRKVDLMERQQAREMDAVREELIDAATNNIRVKEIRTDPEKTEFEKLQMTLRGAHAELTKMEFIIDRLDGKDPLGPWRTNVWAPLREAENQRLDLMNEYTLKFIELTETHLKEKRSEYQTKKAQPLLGMSITKQGLLSAALNLGNESNKRKLLEGYGWTEQQLMAVLDAELSRSDWQFVQGVWDLIETLWPRIEEQEKRLTGVVPEKVERSTVRTRHGEFEGGYYPVVYDASVDDRAYKNATKGLYKDLKGAAFRRPVTGHGFTQERTGFVGPVALDLGVVPSHLDQVIHDLTHRSLLMETDRLLNHDSVRESLDSTIGREQQRRFRIWLQGIATDNMVENRNLQGFTKLLRAARRNITTATLGFRPTTLLMQPLGNFNAMQEMRKRVPNWKRHYLAAWGQTLGSLRANTQSDTFKSVVEASGFMRNRINQIDRDARDVIRNGMGKTRWDKRAIVASMKTIGAMQMFSVDMPVWLATYNAGVAEQNMTHKQAVQFADSVVSISQASAGAMDLSGIQRGDEGIRQVLLFFTWRNTVYNQIANDFHDTKSIRDVPGFLAAQVFRLMLPAIGAALVHQNLFAEDDDEWGMMKRIWDLTWAEGLGTIPLVQFGRFSNDSAPQRMVDLTKDVWSSLGDVAEGEDMAERDLLFDALRLEGVRRGLPVDWLLRQGERSLEE